MSYYRHDFTVKLIIDHIVGCCHSTACCSAFISTLDRSTGPNRYITASGSRGFRGGAGVADTTRGTGMGYGIMKSTSHSRGASPHLSWGSQIAQVTEPPRHDPHTRCAPNHTTATLHQNPAAMCSLYFICLPRFGVTAPRIWAAISPSHPPSSPFIFILRSRIKYPSWFHAGKKKKRKTFRKWKL